MDFMQHCCIRVRSFTDKAVVGNFVKCFLEVQPRATVRFNENLRVFRRGQLCVPQLMQHSQDVIRALEEGTGVDVVLLIVLDN